MKILYIADGFSGCSLYRMEIPHKYLSKYPNIETRIIHRSGIPKQISTLCTTLDELKWADIIVIQQCFDPTFLEQIKQVKSQGVKIIYELDDDIYNLPTWNPAHAFYQRVRSVIDEYIFIADALTVTTQHLKQQLSSRHDKIYVCPNSIDFEEIDRGHIVDVISPLDKECNHLPTDEFFQRCRDKIIIGWLGSTSHKKDLEILIPVLKRITYQYHDRVMVLMGGCTHNEIVRTISYDNVMFLEMVEPNIYLRYLKSLPLDIGLAPLDDILFNKSKSNLKILEYMSIGAVPVASNLNTYNDTITNNTTGYLCNTSIDFIQSIRSLIENPDVLYQMKRKCNVYVREHFDIEKNIKTWISAYKEVLYK